MVDVPFTSTATPKTRRRPIYSASVALCHAWLGLTACGATAAIALNTKDPAIHTVRTTSERYYPIVHHGLTLGAAQYVDRPYRFGSIPPTLVGATFIRTANDDKAETGPHFLELQARQPITVYIAYDNRASRLPDWLSSFTATGEQVLSDDLSAKGFSLYRRDFPVGPVVLGGNGVPPRPGSMYTVIVTAANKQNLPPVAEASLDRLLWWPSNSVRLHGSSANDAGSQSNTSYRWSLDEGPAPVLFENAADPLTQATFATTGLYRLRLTVSDGEHSRYDLMRVDISAAVDAHERAARNAKLAQTAFRRSQNFHQAWLAKADRTTGLIPRGLRGPFIWSGYDAAADCYPFLVLSSALTEPPAFAGPCRAMLETERTLTARLGVLPDNWDLEHQCFYYPEPNMERIQFAASEYVKDGLLAITEWLGPSPWSDRMLELVNACWAQAEEETPFGPLVSRGHENNGEMLQVLSRLYWMTGERRYLDWAQRLGDYYLLGTNHPTRDTAELRLRDHGCEILSGLCELYATCRFAEPEKANAYHPPLYEMLDRVLEVGVNEDGFFYDIINPQTGAVLSPRLGDTFAYNLNGYYTVYLADGHTPYRDAALKVLRALPRFPAFNGAEAMDGNADALEGALYFQNREPHPALAAWIDHAAQTLWSFQKEDGTIQGNYLDGNFSRSTLLYALWKTQGTTLQPWRDDLQLGATRRDHEVLLYLYAATPWSGRLHFDQPRHRVKLHLPFDWPRINQFSPEWTTVESGGTYTLENTASGTSHRYRGEDLLAGLPIALKAGEELRLRLTCEDPPLPTRITTPDNRTAPPGTEIHLAGVGENLHWEVTALETNVLLAEGAGNHLHFTAPKPTVEPTHLRIRLLGAGGTQEHQLTISTVGRDGAVDGKPE